jgi:hypothetical protein
VRVRYGYEYKYRSRRGTVISVAGDNGPVV